MEVDKSTLPVCAKNEFLPYDHVKIRFILFSDDKAVMAKCKPVHSRASQRYNSTQNSRKTEEKELERFQI